MSKLRFPTSLILLAVLGSLGLERMQGAEIRYLTFSARNQYDVYVRDLKLEEVELKIDDNPIEVKYLGYRNLETAFAVILENSPRTAPHNVSIPQLGQINPIDRVRYNMMYEFFDVLTEVGPVLLAEFYKEIEVLQDFTFHDDLLVDSINRMQPNSVGIVFNQIEVGKALGRGVDYLRDRPEKRKILILVTSTIDRDSYRNLEEYQSMLRNTDIEVFVISFAQRSPVGAGVTFEEKMNSYFFRKLVGETAGHAYITGEYAYLEDLFTDLKGRVLNSYTVGFYLEPEPDVDEHDVELKILRDKCKVWHRKILPF